jgi:hypothetical protein
VQSKDGIIVGMDIKNIGYNIRVKGREGLKMTPKLFETPYTCSFTPWFPYHFLISKSQ